jgi:cysteinyl-tRNA synthetase
MRAEERDTFSYEISQQTTVQGRNASDRAIQQSQHARLSASYHQPLYPDIPLHLTNDKSSQNYYYNRIDDDATSVANIAYKNGRLVQASLTQSTRQTTDVKKYVAGELQQELNTPSSVSRSWDLLNLIETSKPKEDGSANELDRAHWQNTMASISNLVLMKYDPTQLRAAGLAGAKEVDAG